MKNNVLIWFDFFFLQNQPKKMMSNLIWISKLIKKKQKRAKIIRKQKQKNLSYKSPLKKCTKIIKLKKITFQYYTYYKHTSYICLFSMNSFFFVRTIKMPNMAKKNTYVYDKNIRLHKLVANCHFHNPIRTCQKFCWLER